MRNQDILDNLEGTEIAVVGMAGRFPGAGNVDEYWQNLRDGVESTITYTDDELRQAGVSETLLRHPHYVKSGAPLEGMELFDAAFFGFGPRDAAIMDPQHRHFLEIAWTALEHAGYDPNRVNGRVGVFGGSGHNAYMPYNLLTNPDLVQSIGFFLLRHTGNDKDFLTTRVSYLFDLRGPSVNVQTACSTSLVAIHLGAQSLLSGECDLAMAGGVTLELPHRQGYLFHEGEILSPDGHCRAFDADSEGTVFGSGVGVVVLKRLADAVEDGDTIHAVVLGSAVNNDGAGKVNYLAPSVDGQAAAIAEAIALAGLDADAIDYVEAHGTGTRIGDPIEVTALTQAFRQTTDKNQFAGIGSVKTNIGHLDTAAGVAGFIKLVQALKHEAIPPTLNFTAPNPIIDFDNSPFSVVDAPKPWPRGNRPRRAGISSLGVGGTNAHIVVEEAPLLEPSDPAQRPFHLLTLSAKTATALDTAQANLAAFLRDNPDANLADVAYTLQVGRQEMTHRRAIAVADHADAVVALENSDRQRLVGQKAPDSAPSLVFMFPGGGAQYPNMGRELYETEPAYREVIDECLDLVSDYLDEDLRSLMFCDEGEVAAKAEILQRPSLALPALYMTEVALTRLIMSWGIEPTTTTGHSMGEYTSAHFAGVLSLADGLKIVTWRGQLFETLPAGAMLSVQLSEEKLAPLLIDDLDIAVINAPELCVVSGKAESIEKMAGVLTNAGVEFRRIKIDVAAHSAMLDPILDEFGRRLRTIDFQPPLRPYISNVTGTWVRPEDATDPDYWVRHLRHTVRFADGLGELLKQPNRIFLEVGPGRTLTALTRMHPDKKRDHVPFNTMRHPKEDVSDLQFTLTALGHLWAAGATPDWQAFHGNEMRHRIPLPTYPFERQRHWIEPGTQLFSGDVPTKPVLAKMPNLDDWFYQPAWEQVDLPPTVSATPQRWLLFQDELGLGIELAQRLKQAGHEVLTVTIGERFRRNGDAFILNPRARVDYDTLWGELAAEERLPQAVIHLWTLNARASNERPLDYYYRNQDLGFYSLFFLAQVLGEADIEGTLPLHVFTNGTQHVADEAIEFPEKATLLGPVKVIPSEFPHLTCRLVDLPLPADGRLPANTNKLLAAIYTEIHAKSDKDTIAYRHGRRYVQKFDPMTVPPADSAQTPFRDGGVYLITGGMGGIGLTMAQYLAQQTNVRLALTSRSGLPPRAQWATWQKAHGRHDRTSRKIQKVQALETLGAEVLVLAADVTNRRDMTTAVQQITTQLGAINGVIHAAGVLDDNLISLKSAAETGRVIAPKVRGTLLLDELLAGSDPDFVVYFSSTSTVLGSAGQVDYVAANSFLNAYAEYKTAVSDTPHIAINWGVWQEVGMAFEAAREQGLVAEEAQPVGDNAPHPLLARFVEDSGSTLAYATDLAVDNFWILDEHRIKDGEALIPGTGYLELARAAFNRGDVNGRVEIRELFFLAPLAVRPDETREVRVILKTNTLPDSNTQTFTVTSKTAAESGWTEHVRGELAPIQDAIAPLDLDAISARCQQKIVTVAPGQQKTRQETFLDFGPRWKNLRQVQYGNGEAIARLELDKTYATDLDKFALHPALMDLATSFGLPLLAGYESSEVFYVPLSYQRVRAYKPLPRSIVSYARPNGQATIENEVPTFDITITDENGNVLVEIDHFMMKRVSHADMVQNLQPAESKTATVGDERSLLQLALTDGITPHEGTEALARILAAPTPHIIVTSLDLDALQAQARPEDEDNSGLKLSRPELQSDYKEPRNSIEETLIGIWEGLLGIDQVGIHDDFFELGGHSLIAVRLFAKIKKAYSVDLSLATLFEAPTVAAFAELLQRDYGVAAKELGTAETAVTPTTTLKPVAGQPAQKEWSPLVAIQPKGKKPPFFCVHGGFGNVLNFYDLTRYLGSDQPFYGLQARGVDGRRPAAESIPQMAASYIDAMRTVQPTGPYYLGGFSMGGEVAYEMVQQLEEAGEKVALLVLLDTIDPGRIRAAKSFSAMNTSGQYQMQATQNPNGRGPQSKQTGANGRSNTSIPQQEQPVLTTRFRRLLAKNPKEQMWSIIRWLDGRTKALKRWQTVTTLNLRVAYLLRTSQTLPQDLISPYLWEAHTDAMLDYTPQPYRGSGRVVLFRASATASDGVANLRLGWASLVQDQLKIHPIEGTHNIVREPYVAEVARLLTQELTMAQRRPLA